MIGPSGGRLWVTSRSGGGVPAKRPGLLLCRARWQTSFHGRCCLPVAGACPHIATSSCGEGGVFMLFGLLLFLSLRGRAGPRPRAGEWFTRRVASTWPRRKEFRPGRTGLLLCCTLWQHPSAGGAAWRVPRRLQSLRGSRRNAVGTPEGLSSGAAQGVACSLLVRRPFCAIFCC